MCFFGWPSIKSPIIQKSVFESYLTVVENSSKRCAVKPITAVKGFFCSKRHAECVSVHHFLSHNLKCTALLKWWQANIVWTEQNLPTSGRKEPNIHSNTWTNSKNKRAVLLTGIFIFDVCQHIELQFSIIPKANIRQQLWSLPNVRFHRLCVENRKHLHFTFNFWTR